MADPHDQDPDPLREDDEVGAIGVGMGGSCPSCRAPVDLGQEFCLECGAPIRFTPRQRRRSSGAGTGQRAAAGPGSPLPPPPRRGGFPWVPFLVVLALIGGGVAFALVDGNGSDRSGSGSRESTEDALPEITNSVPQTTSSTSTVTLQDCDPAQPLAGTEPAIPGVDPSTDSLPADDMERIPELGDGGGSGGQDEVFAPGGSDPGALGSPDVPSAQPPAEGATDGGSGATVTVDQNGNLCSSGGTDDAGNDVLDEEPPIEADPGANGNSSSSDSGTWPEGRSGWTVVVFGFPTRERALQRAVDLQQDGFDDGGVLFSSDFTSLCPGFHVVYSGVFSSKSPALARKAELERKGYAGTYDREIRTDGAPITGCDSVGS